MASIRYYLVLGSTNFCEEFYESELEEREIGRIEVKALQRRWNPDSTRDGRVVPHLLKPWVPNPTIC